MYLGHARLPDIDAEFEQLAIDPRRSPQRIGKAHSRIKRRISTGTFGLPQRGLDLQRQ